MERTATMDGANGGHFATGRGDRFFMSLLLGAGIAAGAVIGFGLVWNDAELGIAGSATQQADIQPVGP